jgi:hypothetical protein
LADTHAGLRGEKFNFRYVHFALLAFFSLALAYLAFKVFQRAPQAGFDYRYMWMAGELWSRGINPYDPAYREIGAAIIQSGHVPTMWPYPPNWFVPSVAMAALDLNASAVAFNILDILFLVLSSALLTLALYRPPAVRSARGLPGELLLALRDPRAAFFLHFGLIAGMEATALVLSVGQNSILIYLGVALLIFGAAKRRPVWMIAGLVIVLLKPQVGVVFAAVAMLERRNWKTVVLAGVAAALLSAPALISSPTAPLDWLANLSRYDGMNTANAPAAMTGVRNLVFDVFGADIGNMASAAITLAVAMGLCLTANRWSARELDTADRMALTAAVCVALAPLHHYDLVLVGAALLPLARGRPWDWALAAAGAALLWRADSLAGITGFYDASAQHFEGSRLAGIGALLLLAAVARAIGRPEPTDESAGRGRPALQPAP